MEPLLLGTGFVSGLFGAGVLWGVTKAQLADHTRRIERAEKGLGDVDDKIDTQVVPPLARLEGQVDVLVKNLVKEAK